MKTKKLLTALAAALIGMAASHGQSILLGGFDGTQTQTAVGSTSQTLTSGVRQLTGGKQDGGAVGKVVTRIWTDQTTNKELQWAQSNISTTTGDWGLTNFTTDASTASGAWVATQQAASWINFEISNTGTGDVTLDKFHISAKRVNSTTAPSPDTLTISLVDNGTFANPPVLSSSALTASGTQAINLNATTTWDAYEFALSSMLSDLTLAAGETATFRIANNLGSNRLYLDNIAISGTVISGPANPVDAGTSTVAASPAAVIADGTSTSTITVTLKDSSGTPVLGEGVTLAKTSGPGTPAISPAGTQTTNGSGVATFTVSSSTVGTNTFTATSVTNSVVVTQTASVDFLSALVDAASSTVSASPTAVPADNATTSTITVTVKNSGGTPLPGKVVSLSGDGSATITTAGAGTDTTNAGGVATFKVKSGTLGTETFTATSDSVTITQNASVDFQAVPPADAGTSTVVASPTSVPADGTSTSTITVTLKDGSGTPVGGKLVSLANTSGPQVAVITAVNATTNASGAATFTVKSGTSGIEVFTATSDTDSVVVTQTVSVTFTQVGAVLLTTLLNDPVSATTSSATGTVANFYDGTETLTDVGTTNNRGGSFNASGVDSDGVSGTNAHTVVYDMGTTVSFNGFVHAQRKADGVDDVASIDFWVTATDPGNAATAIPLPIFTSQPTPDDSVNLARNTALLTEYLLPGGTRAGRYVVMRLNSARTSGANPGGYTLLLGQSGSGPGTGYASWSGGAAANGDANGDSVTNAVAYALGASNVNENAISRLPGFNNSDPSNFVFTFNRSDAAEADIKTTITVQYGSDLSGWTTAVNGENGVSIDDSAVPSPGLHTVVVTIPKSGGKLFARLKVVVAP